MSEAVDHEARGMAKEALIRQAVHEKRCEERMVEIRDFNRDIRTTLRAALLLIVTTLLAVIGFLFCRALGWV
jgi:hypothetical protein